MSNLGNNIEETHLRPLQISEEPTIVQAIAVLAHATEVGPDVHALTQRSSFPLQVVEQIVIRMRAAGLWTSTVIDQSGWWGSDGEFDAQAFFHQAEIAAGRAESVAVEDLRETDQAQRSEQVNGVE